MKDGPGIVGGGQWNRSQLPTTRNRLFPSMQSTVGSGIGSRSAHWERKISNRDRIKVLERSCGGLKKECNEGAKGMSRSAQKGGGRLHTNSGLPQGFRKV